MLYQYGMIISQSSQNKNHESNYIIQKLNHEKYIVFFYSFANKLFL
jgi:hypothetical protein